MNPKTRRFLEAHRYQFRQVYRQEFLCMWFGSLAAWRKSAIYARVKREQARRDRDDKPVYRR